jgi:glycine/serine hydroxymethyltransferase
MGASEIKEISRMIVRLLSNMGDEGVERDISEEVEAMASRFPVPGLDS